MTTNWSIIENQQEYQKATSRFEEINEAKKGTPEYKEMLLLALLINQYEKKTMEPS